MRLRSLADTVGAMAGDAARWTTGAVFPVDAGMSAVLPLASPAEAGGGA